MEKPNHDVGAQTAVKSVNVASLVILVYDWLLTLARITSLVGVCFGIWRSHGTSLSLKLCVHLYNVESWFTFVGVVFALVIMLLRTRAVYFAYPKIIICLIVFILVCILGAIVTIHLFLRSVVYEISPFQNIGGCYPIDASDIIFVTFLIVLFFDSTVMTLTGVSAIGHFRHSNSPLLEILYRDGVLYFGIAFFLSLSNILVTVLAPTDLLDLLSTFQLVMHCVLATRITLHLRSAAAADTFPSEPTSTSARIAGTRIIWRRTLTAMFPRNELASANTDTYSDEPTELGALIHENDDGISR